MFSRILDKSKHAYRGLKPIRKRTVTVIGARRSYSQDFLHNLLHDDDPTQPNNRDFAHSGGCYAIENTW